MTRCALLYSLYALMYALLYALHEPAGAEVEQKGLRVSDQRGKPMRFVNAQGEPDLALEPMLRQRVVSLVLVTPAVAPA